MNLRSISTVSKLAILQKLKLDCLVKVRKTSKELDTLVESNRYEFAKRALGVDFHIKVKESHGCSDVIYSVEIKSGHDYVRRTLTDPYKQLSAVNFTHIWVENRETLDKLYGTKLHDILQNSVFPLLKRMRPTCNYFYSIEISTLPLLMLAKLIRSFEFVICSNTGYSTDLDLVAISANRLVQKSSCFALDGFSSIVCSQEILTNFTAFSRIRLTDVKTKFIASLVEHLYNMDDLGNLSRIEIKTGSSVFSTSLASDSHSDAVIYVGRYPEKYYVISLFYGAYKWIICEFHRNPSWSSRNKLTIRCIDKDPALLLDTLLEIIVLDDDSSLREEFINTSNMRLRLQMFRTFFFNSANADDTIAGIKIR